MITFNHPPIDRELQTLVEPEGAPPYLTLNDDGNTLTCQPRAWPAALYWGSMSMPIVGCCIAVVWGGSDRLVLIFSIVMTIVMVTIAIIGWFVFDWYNRNFIRADMFFILDRAAGTLTLFRDSQVLKHGEVIEVVEVHAWHTRKFDDGSSSEYLREVSVLARDPAGQFVRHQVAIAGHAKPIGIVAAKLANAFAAPHRKLVESLRGGSCRRVSVPSS